MEKVKLHITMEKYMLETLSRIKSMVKVLRYFQMEQSMKETLLITKEKVMERLLLQMVLYMRVLI